ncbi:MAG: LysM peptidoglycan-binding domain-containing protein [Proteobacteria bacterium]|nr:LysM peptidoglycan-binding domain-containing protein [Pseudomonadota bacterium]NDC24228.1 LysM peptidoglycan-binding domain-containing protein [Pseudomonadota bacterium]NDD04239.1 LysM peptidoglycan-binding domain-containing protein [Pseudomonadota bacterium]NDG26801.1 LysM peptidoglycan-binding domain-containing protein [Pseudomonadota bacterium]
MKIFWLSLCFLIGTSSFAGNDVYQLFEDPKKGPERLKKWRIPEPLSEEEWERIVGTGTNDYTVKSGDTLSKISKKELGNRDYWPKLWEVNREGITNPHLIEPDQQLTYTKKSQPTRTTAAEASAAPAQTAPLQPGKAVDIEEGLELSRLRFSNSHRLRFFFLGDEQMLGIVTGSYQDGNSFLAGQELFVGAFDKNRVLPGKSYIVVREVSSVPDKIKAFGDFGKLLQVVGEVKIDQYGDDLAKAIVVQAFDLLQRGDRLIELSPIKTNEKPEVPPANLSCRIMFGENLDSNQLFRGNLVVVDKGIEAGMKTGFVFRVFDDVDNHGNVKLIEPRSKGEIKIAYVGKKSSVGLVTKNRDPLKPGEVLVSPSILEENTLGIKKLRETVLID